MRSATRLRHHEQSRQHDAPGREVEDAGKSGLENEGPRPGHPQITSTNNDPLIKASENPYNERAGLVATGRTWRNSRREFEMPNARAAFDGRRVQGFDNAGAHMPTDDAAQSLTVSCNSQGGTIGCSRLVRIFE